MQTTIIVQARMNSTRLPGKVLKSVLGKPLLEYLIERLRRVKLANEVIIAATTTNAADQQIVDLCTRLNLPCFRGSENDVLARYNEAAIAYYTDVVVRVTSDCPLIDPLVIDEVIEFYNINHKQFDYGSNTLKRSFPRGMDVEIFSSKVLTEAFTEATKTPDREHVTSFFYRHPERFRLANVVYIEDQSYHRWTVDTIEDFELIKLIIENLYPQKVFFYIGRYIEFTEITPRLGFYQFSHRTKENWTIT